MPNIKSRHSTLLPPFSDSAAAKFHHEKSNGVEVKPKSVFNDESPENEEQDRPSKGHKAPAATPTPPPPPPPPPTQSQLPSLPAQPPSNTGKFLFPGRVNFRFRFNSTTSVKRMIEIMSVDNRYRIKCGCTALVKKATSLSLKFCGS